VWPRMRHCRSYKFVGWERALQRASAVGGRSLEHDGCPTRCPNVRRQQPRSGYDHVFMGPGNTRRHSVQPRGPRHVWQQRPRRLPWSYVRVHIDESRLGESSCRRPAPRGRPSTSADRGQSGQRSASSRPIARVATKPLCSWKEAIEPIAHFLLAHYRCLRVRHDVT
jgi:hypothetical protein